MKKQNLVFGGVRDFFYWNETLYDAELIEKKFRQVRFCDFR